MNEVEKTVQDEKAEIIAMLGNNKQQFTDNLTLALAIPVDTDDKLKHASLWNGMKLVKDMLQLAHRIEGPQQAQGLNVSINLTDTETEDIIKDI